MNKEQALDFFVGIFAKGNTEEIKAMFGFDDSTGNEEIVKKFRLFSALCFPKAYSLKSAEFHRQLETDLVASYIDGVKVCNMFFRDSGKTTKTKLFVAFVLLNDNRSKKREFIKILSKDLKNPKQIVTDVYNMIIDCRWIYGDVFMKEDDKKREETMTAFTMKDSRSLVSATIGQSQRGHMRNFTRPDWIIFDDVEDRSSVSSSVITNGIIAGIDEALTGIAHEGSFFALCNYISESGAVEWIKKRSDTIRIVPIMDEKGTPTWQEKFPAEAIDKLKRDSFDFYGEYMCDPQRGENKFFPIDRLEQDMRNAREATKEMLGVKYWGQYTPNHRYGIGSDHSEGIGLDSNAFCVFDFKTGELVARYANNKIAPDLHAHECMRVGGEFGNCVWAMEVNNKCGGTVLTTANNQSYPRIFKMTKNGEVTTKQGWETTKASKTQMLMEFRTAYIDGDIKIYDMDLLMEMKSFTNTDLTDSNDTGLLTRHFDLLMSACIAWQTNPQAEEKRQEQYTPLEAPSFYRLRSYP